MSVRNEAHCDQDHIDHVTASSHVLLLTSNESVALGSGNSLICLCVDTGSCRKKRYNTVVEKRN